MGHVPWLICTRCTSSYFAFLIVHAARAQLWSSLDGGFRSEAALLLFLLAAPRSPRYAQLRSLSLAAVKEGDARSYETDGRWVVDDESGDLPSHSNYAELVEAARAIVRDSDLWLAAHPLCHFPPLPSSVAERNSLERMLFDACNSARGNGVAERAAARLERYRAALLPACAGASVRGPGPALPAASLLFPQLTALSIVGADNMVSVDLGCCPNLERLSLRLCGSLARIELGGAGRRLTALEIGGVGLDPGAFRDLVDGLSRAGCRLRECRLGVPPTDAKHFAARAKAQKCDLKSSVNAGELFEQNLLASAPSLLARRMSKNSITFENEFLGDEQTECFLTFSLSILLALPALLGELRVLSLHGAWWQVGSHLEVPFADLVRLGRAAPSLEELTLTQARLPAGLDASFFRELHEPEVYLAPSCLCGLPEVVRLALRKPGPSGTAIPPFPRLRAFILDGQDCQNASAGALAELLPLMPALARFEMAFNDYARHVMDDDGVGSIAEGLFAVVTDADSAPIATALRAPGCGGGRLNVFRSHDLILGFVGDDPRDERCVPCWSFDHVGPEDYLDGGALPRRPRCAAERWQKRRHEVAVENYEAEREEFELVRCGVCDGLNAYFCEHYNMERVERLLPTHDIASEPEIVAAHS